MTSSRDLLPPEDPPSALKRLFPEAASSLADGTPLQLGGPEARGGFMGLYARVVEGGQVETGDKIELLDG